VGGDRAWARADFTALRHIAQQLSARFGARVHCDLLQVADLCGYDLETAGALWARVKGQLYRSTPTTVPHVC